MGRRSSLPTGTDRGSLPVGSTAKHDVATGTSPLFKVAIGGKDYFVKQIKGGSELAQAQGLGSLAVRGGDLDPIKGLRNETLTAGLAQIAGVPVPAVSATTFQGRQALVTEWLPGKALADVKDARSAVLKLPEGQVAQQLLFAYLADLSDRHLGNYFVSNNKLYSIDHEFGYDVHETDQHFQKREQIGRVFDNELFKLVGGPRHLTAGQGYDYPLPQSVVGATGRSLIATEFYHPSREANRKSNGSNEEQLPTNWSEVAGPAWLSQSQRRLWRYAAQACHALLIQVEGNFTRLLGGACGWSAVGAARGAGCVHDPSLTETAQEGEQHWLPLTPVRYNSL
jgi:hypothetical protein